MKRTLMTLGSATVLGGAGITGYQIGIDHGSPTVVIRPPETVEWVDKKLDKGNLSKELEKQGIEVVEDTVMGVE